ncbi:hypothetical protein J0H33_01060, partial [bacterium]|nr:hypothetical protein [bacterium]
MRFPWTVVGAAILIVVSYLLLSWIVDGYFGGHIYPDDGVINSWAAPDSWSNWRDIVIVIMGVFWAIAGMLAIALMVILIFLALLIRRVVKENAVPAIDSLKDSLDNVRGTTEFAGETIVSPLVRTYAVVKGVRQGISTVKD